MSDLIFADRGKLLDHIDFLEAKYRELQELRSVVVDGVMAIKFYDARARDHFMNYVDTDDILRDMVTEAKEEREARKKKKAG